MIANGVDAARFAAAGRRRRGSPWRATYGRYVLAVGGIEPRKGTLDLVEAMALRRVPAPLVIAGGDTLFDYRPYRAAVFERAAALGVEPVVLGPVDDDALPGLVAGAAVFAFPSTKEGFGLAAMEALAAGVPLVTRDLPVLREVFADCARFATDPADLAAALDDALHAGPDPTRAAAGRALAASPLLGHRRRRAPGVVRGGVSVSGVASLTSRSSRMPRARSGGAQGRQRYSASGTRPSRILDALLAQAGVLLVGDLGRAGAVGAQDAVPGEVGAVGAQDGPDDAGRALARHGRDVAVARHAPGRDGRHDGADALVPGLVHVGHRARPARGLSGGRALLQT